MAGAAGFLEGLVGGALAGADFRRTRDLDKADANERARKAKLEAARQADEAEARRRAYAIQDLGLRNEYGLSFENPMSAEDLRKGTGRALVTFNDVARPENREAFLRRQERGETVPEGMYRVGPSASERAETAAERARQLRIQTGTTLAQGAGLLISGETAAAAADFDVLDNLIERYGGSSAAPYKVNVGGISTEARTPEEALAARERFAVPDVPDDKSFDRANALSDDFWREAQVSVEVASAVSRARAAGNNAVGDQTKIIALNKLLDPGSIVREGEFNRVGSAGGLEARAQYYYNQMKDGRLPDTLRKALEDEIEAQARTASESFLPTINRYRQRAQAYGLDPDQVTFDPFIGLSLDNPYRN